MLGYTERDVVEKSKGKGGKDAIRAKNNRNALGKKAHRTEIRIGKVREPAGKCKFSGREGRKNENGSVNFPAEKYK